MQPTAKIRSSSIKRLTSANSLTPASLVSAKRFIARNNMTFNLGKVKSINQDELKAISSPEWGSCVKHVHRTGNKYRALDIAIDDEPQPFVALSQMVLRQILRQIQLAKTKFQIHVVSVCIAYLE